VDVDGGDAHELLGRRQRAVERFGVLLRLRPRRVRAVALEENLDLLLGALGIERAVPVLDDVALIFGSLDRRRVHLDEEPVRLVAALPLGLRAVALGDLDHDVARVALAADRREEVEHFLRRDRAIFGEHDDEVFERFVAQVRGAAALRLGAGALGLDGLVEHALEVDRGFLCLAELPLAPSRLEQREVRRLRGVGDVSVRSLGFLPLAGGEVVLADHHPRVAVERRIREPRDHFLEAIERFFLAIVFLGREPDQVRDQIHAVEARELLVELLVERFGLFEIDPRLLRLLAVTLLLRALFDRAREVVHLDEVRAARFFPQQLGELEHALRAGLALRVAREEAAQKADRLDALVVALLLGRGEEVLELLREHRRFGRRRALADVELGRRAALDGDLVGRLLGERGGWNRQGAKNAKKKRESGLGDLGVLAVRFLRRHRQPSYSSAQYSPWNGQYSSSSPIIDAFHSRPMSSSGKRPAARS